MAARAALFIGSGADRKAIHLYLGVCTAITACITRHRRLMHGQPDGPATICGETASRTRGRTARRRTWRGRADRGAPARRLPVLIRAASGSTAGRVSKRATRLLGDCPRLAIRPRAFHAVGLLPGFFIIDENILIEVTRCNFSLSNTC